MSEIKWVCEKCVIDKYLKKYIKDNGQHKSEVKCDCCGEGHEYVIAYEKFAKYVTECIERVYQPTKESVPMTPIPLKDENIPTGLIPFNSDKIWGNIEDENMPTGFIPFSSDKIWGSIEDEQRIFGENIYTVMSDFGDTVSTMEILHSITKNKKLIEQLLLYIGVVNYKRKDFSHKDKHSKNKWDLFAEYVKYKKEHVFDFDIAQCVTMWYNSIYTTTLSCARRTPLCVCKYQSQRMPNPST